MKDRVPLSLALAFGLSVLGSCPAWAENGYKLKQRSDFWGQQLMYVSDRTVYMTAPKLNLRFFMQAPDWKVTGINDTARTYVTLTYEQWKNDVLTRRHRGSMPHVKVGHDVVARVQADKYLVLQEERPQLIVDVPDLMRDGVRYNSSVWVAPSMIVPKPLMEILNVSIHVETGLGMPLRAKQYTAEGKEVVSFDTLLCEKVQMPKDLFKVPAGYHRVANEVALVFCADADPSPAATLPTLEPSVAQSEPAVPVPKSPAVEGWVPGDQDSGQAASALVNTGPARGFWVPGE